MTGRDRETGRERRRLSTWSPSSSGSMMSSRSKSGVRRSSASQNWEGRSKPSASIPWLCMV